MRPQLAVIDGEVRELATGRCSGQCCTAFALPESPENLALLARLARGEVDVAEVARLEAAGWRGSNYEDVVKIEGMVVYLGEFDGLWLIWWLLDWALRRQHVEAERRTVLHRLLGQGLVLEAVAFLQDHPEASQATASLHGVQVMVHRDGLRCTAYGPLHPHSGFVTPLRAADIAARWLGEVEAKRGPIERIPDWLD